MAPWLAARCAFFAAAAWPLLRKMLMAASRSPLLSTSAARQSPNPAPVRSRRDLTNCAGMGVFLRSVLIVVDHYLTLDSVRRSGWSASAPPEMLGIRRGPGRIARLQGPGLRPGGAVSS